MHDLHKCCATFLRATAGTAISRLSHRNSVRLSVCLSVRPSHGWIRQKRCKLGYSNLHHRCPKDSSFRICNAFPKFPQGSPQSRALNERGVGKFCDFEPITGYISEKVQFAKKNWISGDSGYYRHRSCKRNIKTSTKNI